MNILITTGLDSSIISFGNMGDISMLQSGLVRLRKNWPNASLNVLTDWPEILVRFCPEVVPIPAVGRNLWVGEDILLGRFETFVPDRLKQVAIKSRRAAAVRFPVGLKHFLKLGLRLQNRRAKGEALSTFSESIAAADLVVACGAGGFYDSCRGWNMNTLDVIEAAVQRRIPVAMFGQHFGPLTDPVVLSRAVNILPAVDLITLRGRCESKAFLESLGVDASRIEMTGDEAIELAYPARPQNLGAGLGVNFRLRTSAGTSDNDIEMLRPILQRFAKDHHVSLIPAPIAVDSSTCDYAAVKLLLQGFDDQTDGGAHLASPVEVIKQVGRCRVLVTCAYHAAVFALAQGIPVVALAKSSYFVEKFLGLRERFGLGLEIVHLDRPDAGETFRNLLDRSWTTAEDVRISLLDSAKAQMDSGWKAYNRLKQLVTSRVDSAPKV